MSPSIPPLIEARRSIRTFAPEPVPRAVVDALVRAACLAPAPHHSQPWRWVSVETPRARAALATAMGERWRRDLLGDGRPPDQVEALLETSDRRIHDAPALVLGCLTDDGLDRYPDLRRRTAETGMALLSLGAAVQNLMLAAADAGYASCQIAAPIFCPDAAAGALELPARWRPQAMVALGRPAPDAAVRTRPPLDLDRMRVIR